MTRVTESQVFEWLRLALGAAAFAVAFAHTLEWLGRHEITGADGVVTAACVDVLALMTLRTLMTVHWLVVRLLAAGGFAGTLALSLVAQYEVGSSGKGAGPWLAMIPVGAFAFLTILREVERAVRKDDEPNPDSLRSVAHEVDIVEGAEVDIERPARWTSEVDIRPPAEVDIAPVVSTSMSTPWERIAELTEGLPVRPELATLTPCGRPRNPRRKRPEKARTRVDLHLVPPADGKFEMTSEEIRRAELPRGDEARLTHAEIASKYKVSTRTVARYLNDLRNSETGQNAIHG